MMNDLMMKRFINEVEMMFLYLYLQIIYLGGARYSVIKGQIIRLIRVENLKEWQRGRGQFDNNRGEYFEKYRKKFF